jgi:hypothetical protein
MIMKDTRGVFGRSETSQRHLKWVPLLAMMALLLATLVVVR